MSNENHHNSKERAQRSYTEEGSENQHPKEPYMLYQASENKNINFLGVSFKEILMHTFLNKVLIQGLKEPFNFNHLFKLPSFMEYPQIKERITALMTPQFKEAILSKKSNICNFYHQFLGYRFKLNVIFIALSDIVIIFIPILLKSFIDWIEEESAESGFSSESSYRGMYLAGLISLVLIASKIFLFIGRYYLLLTQAVVRAFAYVRELSSIHNSN